MLKPRSPIERRFSRTAAIILLGLAAYVLGGPLVHRAVIRMLPGAEPFTRVLYAPLLSYSAGEGSAARWYRAYWVLCDHQVARYE